MQKLRLNSILDASSSAHEDDVLGMKAALHALGDYETRGYGLTPYPDTPMFDAMKRFQKRTGLRIDGIARPGGETERRLNELIQPIARLAGYESSSERKTETHADPDDQGRDG